MEHTYTEDELCEMEELANDSSARTAAREKTYTSHGGHQGQHDGDIPDGHALSVEHDGMRSSSRVKSASG